MAGGLGESRRRGAPVTVGMLFAPASARLGLRSLPSQSRDLPAQSIHVRLALSLERILELNLFLPELARYVSTNIRKGDGGERGKDELG